MGVQLESTSRRRQCVELLKYLSGEVKRHTRQVDRQITRAYVISWQIHWQIDNALHRPAGLVDVVRLILVRLIRRVWSWVPHMGDGTRCLIVVVPAGLLFKLAGIVISQRRRPQCE